MGMCRVGLKAVVIWTDPRRGRLLRLLTCAV